MGMIFFKKGFERIPVGETVLRIKSVDDSKYKDFKTVKITLEDYKGRTHIENYRLYDEKTKEWNLAACLSLDALAAAALNREIPEDKGFNSDELIGKYIRCEVTHDEVDGKTYSRLGREKVHATGFDGETKTSPKSDFDLKDLLG